MLRINSKFHKFYTILLFFLLFGLWFGYNDQYYLFSQQQYLDMVQLNGNYDTSASEAIFANKKIKLAQVNQVEFDNKFKVLGATTGHKRIEIDLTNQRLYAYEDSRLVYNFLISSGKWGRTPTGRFHVWVKLRYTKMEGGSKALHTYYYLPNVPYVMYFYNDDIPKWRGYGIHGTYWHDNFGHPMSHGCVNMKTEEVAQLYYWAQPNLGDKQSIYASADNPGTEILIYGEAPWD